MQEDSCANPAAQQGEQTHVRSRTAASPVQPGGVVASAEHAPVTADTAAQETSPQGEVTADSGQIVTGARPEFPVGGASTPRSWSSGRPGTPNTMKLDVMKPFRPEKRRAEHDLHRVRTTARVLATVGSPMQEGSLEVLQGKN